MVIDEIDTFTNELAEDMSPPTSENQTLYKTDVKITNEEPAMKQYFYPLSLCQCKNMAVTICHMQFSKEEKVMPYECSGKALYNHPETVKVKGGNHYYFCSMVYVGNRLS